MSESIAGETIIDAAKQAALAAAQVLGAGDQIGVIAFQAPSSYWVLPLTSAAQTDVISSAIGPMDANGGDDSIEGVLQLAFGGLHDLNAQAKHVILLTDGETPSGNYQSLAQEMQAQGITISTIGLGNQINVPLLQDVAQLGKGTYVEGNDLWNLPQLVVKQTQDVQRTAIVEQQTQPLVAASDAALSDVPVDEAPPLRGYVATTPKPESTVVLATPQGDPLLAEWQYGLGRVMAWTSDASNRWAADWLTWPGFETFWAQVVKRTLRPSDDPNRQVSVALTGSQAQITLDARTGVDTDAPEYANFLQATADVTGPDGTTQHIALPQSAPGQYQGTVPSETDGVYSVEVNETAADGNAESQASGFVVPYSPEYRDLGTNTAFLAALSAETGGRPIDTPDSALLHDLPSTARPTPLWPFLLVLTAVLFVADIGLRRLRFNWGIVRASRQLVVRRLGSIDRRRGTEGQADSASANPWPGQMPRVGRTETAQVSNIHPTASTLAPSQRLLAAKRRAGRHTSRPVRSSP
jgi:Ca-activated chloride channel homolog